MKRSSHLFLLTCLCAGAIPSAFAVGTNPPMVTDSPPVVTVLATDPNAAEDGPDSGTFQISRTGDPTNSITVYYSLDGSARNGRDYQMLSGVVTFAIGASSTNINVVPILDVDSSAEPSDSVILQLHPLVDIIPHHPASSYAIGWPSNAVVTITESANPPTNRPPAVHLVDPADGAGFVAPASLEIAAQAQDPDGTVKSVGFFAATATDTNSLGVVANPLSGERYRNLFTLDWTNAPAGAYLLTAVATDNSANSATSGPVHITILSKEQIPVVTVAASDANASELGPDTGTFTVTRTGDTTGPLSVYYTLDGTARNGADYQRLPGVVNFAAGASTTNITVTPIPDLDALFRTNDTVVLQLEALHPMGPGLGGLYTVGSPSNAVVTITEDTNAFSFVTVIASDSSAGEDGPDPGTFQVSRTGNLDHSLTVYYGLGGSAKNGSDYKVLPGMVTFAAGAGTTNITILPILDVDHTPETNETVVLQLRPRLDLVRSAENGYSIGWPSNAVVNIQESANPPTNEPPVVRLVNPADGAGFVAPATIPLLAQARDFDGSIAQVTFLAVTNGVTNSIGVVTNSIPTGRNRGLYSLNWTNVPVGSYAVTAVATDNQGANATSAPVHLVVTATALPTVNFSAVDPIAWINIRGTNNATIRVRRSAPTNADLVVYYTVSGSASNGVDYVKLPGSITIPAGQSTAPIIIEPLLAPTGPGNPLRTVTLALQAPATTVSNPPTYLVGPFNQVTAAITSRGSHRDWPGPLGGGIFDAVLPAPASKHYHVEVSTNLNDWQPVSGGESNGSSVEFVDPDAPANSLRFYRVVPDSSE